MIWETFGEGEHDSRPGSSWLIVHKEDRSCGKKKNACLRFSELIWEPCLFKMRIDAAKSGKKISLVVELQRTSTLRSSPETDLILQEVVIQKHDSIHLNTV